MMPLERALRLMLDAHAGQVDKGGEPYVLHPIRVMLSLKSEPERIIALLHDVVEDSDITLAQLSDLGFDDEIVQAIDCLTKREGEDYDQFIGRLRSNDLARKVKVADILDNIDLTRLPSVGDADLKRAQKYHRALRILLTCPFSSDQL